MTPMQILNQLYAGKRITLSFQNESARENFRQRIYKLKKGQDAAVSAVLDEEKLILKCKKQMEPANQFGGHTVAEYQLLLWTEEKKPQSYFVLSIEEGENGSNGRSGSSPDSPQIPKDLAGDSETSSG